MPTYDYRCENCGERLTLFYKTYAARDAALDAALDAATPRCPKCDSDRLLPLITQVTIVKPARDYRKMSSKEMLSVLDSGNKQQTEEMFKQVGGAPPGDTSPDKPIP